MSTKRTPEQSDNKAPDRNPEGVSPTSSELQSPSSQQTDWVLQSLNSAHSKIDELHGKAEDLAKDVVELKVQVVRVEEKVEFLSQTVGEKTKSIPQIDERVRSIERLVWRTSGVLALLVILVPLVRFLLSFLDITIALKP